jgi:hypothetical protein
MALESFVTNLEDVGEDLRNEYEQAEGGYTLKILSGFVAKDKVENVDGLKSALHKERENARTAARRARELEDQFGGFDPKELETLRTEKAAAEEQRAQKAGEWDKLKVQLVTQHQEENGKLKGEIATLKTAYDAQLIDAAVVTAIAGEKGNPTLLKPHVANHVTVVQDDSGMFNVRVVDDAGNPRVNGTGQFIGVSDFVKELREQETFAGAFIGAQSSGGGTPPGGGNGGGDGKKGGIPSDLKRSSMTPRQKVDFIRAHSDADYQKLPA